MATKRRSTTRRAPSRRRRSTGVPSVGLPAVGPEVARSIFGIILLVLGAITLIALTIQGQGS